MNFSINIPSRTEIITQGIVVNVAPSGVVWSKEQLGEYGSKSGVYIHHSNGVILYIGQTTKGEWGTFAERLRREFQEKSSQNSPLFQLLLKQKSEVKTAFWDLEKISEIVCCEEFNITAIRKALIFEQVLIAAFDPVGNVK